MTYDSGNYEAATARAKELFGYDELRAEQRRRRDGERPGAARDRRLDLHRDVRSRALADPRSAQLRRRRLGAREHPDARHGQGRGRHRVRPPHGQGHETAWSQIVADRLGVAVRGRRGAARRHPGRPEGPGHLRLAIARHRRRGARPGGRQGHREGEADRRPPARGERRRPRVRRGTVQRQGHRQGDHPRRGRARDLHRARPAGRRRAEPGRRCDVRRRTPSPSRTARTCAPSRSTPRPGRRGCASYVAVDDIGTIVNPLIVAGQVHGGIVQGIAQALWEERGVRRDGHAGHRLVRRLHPADRRRHDQLRHRPHGVPLDDEHARHQGRRRGRHHRVHTGRRQRHRRRRAPPRRQRHPDAVHPGAGVEGHPGRRVAPGDVDRARPSRTSTDDTLNQDPSAGATDGADQ